MFCSSWLSLSLPKILQVLICSFNNTGPGSNHLFSLESINYSFIYLERVDNLQIPQIHALVVQYSTILFTPKRVSLYLVIEFQCTSPQASGKGIEFSSPFNFIVHTQICFFKATFGDTSPIHLASEKKPLPADLVLLCNSSRQLNCNRTTSEALHIQLQQFAHSTKEQIIASLLMDWSSPFR